MDVMERKRGVFSLLGLFVLLLGFIHEGAGRRNALDLLQNTNEQIEFLTSEEEERLIYQHDDSVINENIKDMPPTSMLVPELKNDNPIPTMDPPLPQIHNQTTKSKHHHHRGFPFNIPKSVMKSARHMLRPLNRRPRMRSLGAASSVHPVAQYRSRPSTLVSSTPDQLEMAFKRIEIMASRVGFNMSSMPRRVQLKVLRRLIPKLPPAMANLVKTAVDNNSDKIFEYLPEPARDPIIEDNPEYLNSFVSMADVKDEFESIPPNPSQESMTAFDADSISLSHDVSHPHYVHSSLTPISGEDSDLHSGLVPPSFNAEHSGVNYDSHVETDVNEGPTSAFGSSSTHHHHHHVHHVHHDPSESSPDLPQPSRLVSDMEYYSNHNTHAAAASENVPQIVTYNSFRDSKAVKQMANHERGNKALKITGVKNATPQPIRVSMPTRDKLVTVKPNTAKPIRVSIISKDSINNLNGSESLMKIVHVEPIYRTSSSETHSMSGEKETAKVEELKNPYGNGEPFIRSSSKEILISISKEVVDEDNDEYKVSSTSTTTTTARTTTSTTTTTTEPPELIAEASEDSQMPLNLDTYKNMDVDPIASESISPIAEYSDPFELTDEEIAATVAELKKYEEEEEYNSLELEYPYRLAPHPLEYPDHPDHPHSTEDDLFQNDYEGQNQGQEADMDSPPLVIPVPMSGSVLLNPTIIKSSNHHQQQQLQQQKQRRPGQSQGQGQQHRRPQHQHPQQRRPQRRPPPPRRPTPKRPPPPHLRPLRINNVEVKEIPTVINKECDYFSDDLCLLVQDYPICVKHNDWCREAISEAIEANPAVATMMLVKEPEDYRSWVDGVPRGQESSYNFKHYFGSRRNGESNSVDIQQQQGSETSSSGGPTTSGSHRHRDFAGEGGFLCPSKVAYGKIKKAKSSTSGDWKYVVNYGDKTQTLRLEKCLSPGNTCSYVMPHYRTACTQVYNYHRLLAWDSEKGLHVDVFKVPTCCTCHVQGYYIPGQSSQGHGFTPALSSRRRDLPPKLNFAPQTGSTAGRQGRGGRKLIHPPMMMYNRAGGHRTLNHIQQGMILVQGAKNPYLPVPVAQIMQSESNTNTNINASAPIRTTTKPIKVDDELDLQELLHQYSSLRERIAKRKNEKIHVSYSMSVSNESSRAGELLSLKPKTRESRFTDTGSFKELKLLKSLIKKNINKSTGKNSTTLLKLKQMYNEKTDGNATKKSVKPTRKSRMSRQRIIDELKRNPKLLNLIKERRQVSNDTKPSSVISSRNGKSMRVRGGRNLSLWDDLKSIISRQSSGKEKSRGRSQVSSAHATSNTTEGANSARRKALIAKARARIQAEKQGNSASNSNKRPSIVQKSDYHQRQRLRVGSNRPSKVNYSYHPIMDYYLGPNPPPSSPFTSNGSSSSKNKRQRSARFRL